MDARGEMAHSPSLGYRMVGLATGAAKKEFDDVCVSGSKQVTTQKRPPPRDVWNNRSEFILSMVGFAIGLGNVWRFPYLCYKNGGGAFLIPYLIFSLLTGLPLLCLELSIGQYMGLSGTKAWNICPLFRGIGLDTSVIVFLENAYYIVILAWNGIYLVDAFASLSSSSAGLPWSTCTNWWNSDRCIESSLSHCSLQNESIDNISWENATNITTNNSYFTNATVCSLNGNVTGAAEEYFRFKVLQMSDDIGNAGGIVWELAIALLVVWIVCYLCIWKGIKLTGKIVYFTALFPYVMMTILLVRGVTLPGAYDGILFYLKPDFQRLLDITVWSDAGTQVLYSFALAIGAHVTLGSFNEFRYDCIKDAVFVAALDVCTSIYSGFAIFSVLGFMAHVSGLPIHEVSKSGPGLVFIAYPTAVSQMPFAQPLWAILFFIMIFFLGLDSQFVAMETFVTGFMDIFSSQLSKIRFANRETITALYCLLSYLVGLTMVTQGGVYVFQLFDYYSGSGIALLWVAFWECCAISWVYGGNAYCEQMSIMLGYKLNIWFKVCWCFLTPLLIGTLFVFQLVFFEAVKYGGSYVYPMWAQGFGLCLALASMICVPGYAIYALATTSGTPKQKLQKLTTPLLSERQRETEALADVSRSLLEPGISTSRA